MDWKDQRDRSKIKRINYKGLLRMSFTQYLINNKHKTNDEILHKILILCRDNPQYCNGLNLVDCNKNIRTSISARRTEQNIYEVKTK